MELRLYICTLFFKAAKTVLDDEDKLHGHLLLPILWHMMFVTFTVDVDMYV